MGNEQDVDVKHEVESEDEVEGSSQQTSKSKGMAGLKPVHANLKEPKPQHTCGVKQPPGDVTGGSAPKPLHTCGVKQPSGDTHGGVKRKPDDSSN